MPNSTREYGSRETTDWEKRANARERVTQTARRGVDPRADYPADDLTWAFEGRDDELVALEELAVSVRERREQAKEAIAASRELQEMTDAVLREQDAERRTKAEAEAKRRLGITLGGKR